VATDINLQLSFASPKTVLNALSETKFDPTTAVAAGRGEALENPVFSTSGQQTHIEDQQNRKRKSSKLSLRRTFPLWFTFEERNRGYGPVETKNQSSSVCIKTLN
jgi:hypothetical protein